MAWLSEHVTALVGVLLLAIAAYIIIRKPSDNNPVTALLAIGAALILLSDNTIASIKFGASGAEVARKELKDVKEDNAAEIARLNSRIAKLETIAIEQQKINDAQRLASAGRSADPKETNLVNTIATASTIAKSESLNSKYSILVFHRPSQRAVADAMVDELTRAGFQSSATPTDLREVIDEVAGNRAPGNAIMVVKSQQIPVLDAVTSIIRRVAVAKNMSFKLDDNEWTLRRGDGQVYLF